MKKLGTTLVCILLVLLMAVSLFACAKKDSGEKKDEKEASLDNLEQTSLSDGEEPEGIQPGTVMNVAWESDKSTHLPFSSDSHGSLYLNIYDTLFYTYGGETTGLIAKDWTVSDDGMEYVINIHDNIDFCNKDGSKGSHMDAKAVVEAMGYTEQYMANYFTNIESYEATGDYEITVKFSAPYPDFMVKFSDSFTGIADPAAIAEHGSESNDAAVGSGPYYIESYSPAEQFVLKANPHYWNPERCAHIETINCFIISDANTCQVTLLNGDIDYFETAEAKIVELLTAEENIVSFGASSAFNPLWFNCNKAPFDNADVRKGIGLLINSEELVQLAYGGYGEVLDCEWSKDCITYKEYPTANEFDPDAGLKLLEDAGVDPEKLVINTYSSYLNPTYMEALQAQLAKYGITLNFEVYEVGTFVQSVGNGDWDIMAWFGFLNPVSPMATYQNMFSEEGFFKCLFIQETYPEIYQEVQDLIAEALQCKTLEEQVVVLNKIDDILAENYFWVTNVQGAEWKVYNSKLKNMTVDDQYHFALFWDLWIDETAE